MKIEKKDSLRLACWPTVPLVCQENILTLDGKQVYKNVGLEKTYDSIAEGVTGKDWFGAFPVVHYVPIEGSEIEPENGKDIITTLDVNIQDIAENALMKMMMQNEALDGTCNCYGNANRQNKSHG